MLARLRPYCLDILLASVLLTACTTTEDAEQPRYMLAGQEAPAGSGVAQAPGRRDSSLVSAQAMRFVLNTCDIDIRPINGNRMPAQTLTVGYESQPEMGKVPAHHDLWFWTSYVDPEAQPMYVTDTGPHKTLLATLAEPGPVKFRIFWDDLANKKARLYIDGTPYATPIELEGQYDAGERHSSPYFEKEEPRPANIADPFEKVRVRCRYKGLAVSFIVWRY